MSSVRSTSDVRGPVTRKRVPDREEPGKPRKDARRVRCHLLEAGFWPLWMTPLPRYPSHQVTKRNLELFSDAHYHLTRPYLWDNEQLRRKVFEYVNSLLWLVFGMTEEIVCWRRQGV